MGKGCVRFKIVGGPGSRRGRPHRPLAKSFGVARVPAEEHMANYQAARALLGKGNSAVTRVKERPGFQRVRQLAAAQRSPQ